MDINPSNSVGLTPLHISADRGFLDICLLIINKLRNGDKNPADFNHGTTPLHAAAENGHIEVCKLIMAHLVNKNPKDNRGLTPSDLAWKKGFYDISKLFSAKKSKIN